MQYKVIKKFAESNSHTILGYFDLKAKARLAIDDDVGAKPNPHITYEIQLVEENLTQDQIDNLIKTKNEPSSTE